MKIFITRNVEKGNIIVTDGWSGYSFVKSLAFYSRDVHIHGGGDFGLGVNSTSHIESIWSQMKAILKHIYYIIFYPAFKGNWMVCEKSK